jgi:threo-3-hydroxy-L-aspartate ammonia-lyase
MALELADIKAAAARLHGVANRTPVMQSRTLNTRLGAEVFLKCENFQRMGAFKFRGAYNAMTRLDADARRRGVLTHSSGNHAQAIALAGRLLGITTTIVMPEDAPAVKLAATREYGGNVVLYNRHQTTREAVSAVLLAANGHSFIPPFDHDDVIAGQGTAGLELIEELVQRGVELDTLVVCLGGGGLLSGCAIAAKALLPQCRVIGVEPLAGNDGMQSLAAGRLIQFNNPDTIADGARTPLCERTFKLIQTHVDGIVCVTDAQLVQAMYFLWERLKIVVEPTGALALAALLAAELDVRGQRVGVIISGGNVDLADAAMLFAAR